MRTFIISASLLLQTTAFTQNVDSSQIEIQVNALIDSSKFYFAKENQQKAFEFQRQAQQLIMEKLGSQSPSLIYCLQHLGNLYFATHDYENAERAFRDALEICKILRGEDHSQYMNILGSLAYIYTTIGKLEEAEVLHIRKKNYHEKNGDTLNMGYSSTLNNLAITKYFAGRYEEAEELYLRTLAIREKVLGKNNADYCGVLINLGSLYSDMGMNERAEPLWLEAKKIFEDSLKNLNHPNYFSCLMNLSAFYFLISNYEKAEKGWNAQLKRFEGSGDTMNPDYALTLANIAEVFRINNQLELAETTLKKSLRINEKLFGVGSEACASMLTKLATLYLEANKLDLAEELLLKAEHIMQSNVEGRHTSRLANLSFMAELYRLKGEQDKVEKILNEYREICVKNLGTDNDYYSDILLSLGIHYAHIKQGEKAGHFFEESSQLDRQILLKYLHQLSETELQKFLKTFSIKQSKLLSGGLDASDATTNQVIFDNCLFYKGFLQFAISQSKKLALSNPKTAGKYLDLKAIERLLIGNYSLPLNERNVEEISMLEEKKTELEKDLARQIIGYEEAIRQVKWQDVQKALKADEAVVEFVQFDYVGRKANDSILYVALVLKPGMKSPIPVVLFEEHALDFVKYASDGRKADYVNRLYTIGDRGASSLGVPMKTLYELIWKPLEKEITNVRKIYFSPSGLLHRINFGAIPVSDVETLADRYQLFQLTSSRHLVLNDQRTFDNRDAVLFGGIRYDLDSTMVNNGPMIVSRSASESGFNALDATMRGGNWNYLPGTEREVNSIEKLMRQADLEVSCIKGIEASEEYFKKKAAFGQRSPRILHVATHGYFFPDAKKEISSPQSAISNNESVFKMSDHPMLRSGLILAGGNNGWMGERTLAGGEDGVLTAYEISQMDLSNTELVVLSACETGLGDIQGNEGVYGLQRAFKIAGAKYLIMSLWQVPDKQTNMLMTTFYKKWLEAEGPDKGGNKMSIPDAFHAAQKELRDLGLDPYQWAGFVLVE